MSNSKEKTIEYYDKEAKAWQKSSGTNTRITWWKKEMEIFNGYLPTGSVIEIGSGLGIDAQALINYGYTYTGIDASASFLEIAKKRILKGNLLKSIFTSWIPLLVCLTDSGLQLYSYTYLKMKLLIR